ncbi:hypothetical protein RHGRI_035421 [Rhododendron griersonianum]|uniref:Uncharacterized protein n=1 Tax=Rhododendron griersonianum TaxID=479676 RepID=A0AAV6I4L1_9ERIC|nr:hypothetical protein RHGRI_035421 [Rhododendron griersonianum]
MRGRQLTRERSNLVSKVSMALSFLKSYLFLHFAIFILFPNSSHADRLTHSKKHVALFIFGDSLFDVGNNNYINTTTRTQANFWPYGETFFNYPTGRFSNGRLIPDFIAEYAKLPLLRPYNQPGNNHQFSNVDVEEIYKAGGRKFGFVSLGPLGCLPLVRALNPAGECVQEVTALVKLHNTAFLKDLKKLEIQLQGFKYSNFDFYNSATERIENPSKYGSLLLSWFYCDMACRSFKDGKSACCGSGPYRGVNSCGGKRGVKEYELCSNPSEYVFFDFCHPTEKANEQLAQQMWKATPSIVGPYNLEALFKQV